MSLNNDPSYDTVSVYDETESTYHIHYEGFACNCPNELMARKVVSVYGALVCDDYGMCICLDRYDGTED